VRDYLRTATFIFSSFNRVNVILLSRFLTLSHSVNDASLIKETDFIFEIPKRTVNKSLRELAELAGVELDKEIADAVIELTRMQVSPIAICSVLKSLCARANESA
jgi:hypothetical protein